MNILSMTPKANSLECIVENKYGVATIFDITIRDGAFFCLEQQKILPSYFFQDNLQYQGKPLTSYQPSFYYDYYHFLFLGRTYNDYQTWLSGSDTNALTIVIKTVENEHHYTLGYSSKINILHRNLKNDFHDVGRLFECLTNHYSMMFNLFNAQKINANDMHHLVKLYDPKNAYPIQEILSSLSQMPFTLEEVMNNTTIHEETSVLF